MPVLDFRAPRAQNFRMGAENDQQGGAFEEFTEYEKNDLHQEETVSLVNKAAICCSNDMKYRWVFVFVVSTFVVACMIVTLGTQLLVGA
jgi:hypothetical protein